MKCESEVWLTLCDPVDGSPPRSSVYGIFQARVLEWVAISFSRESSRLRDRIQVSHIAGRRFNLWATREAHSVLRNTAKVKIIIADIYLVLTKCQAKTWMPYIYIYIYIYIKRIIYIALFTYVLYIYIKCIIYNALYIYNVHTMHYIYI